MHSKVIICKVYYLRPYITESFVYISNTFSTYIALYMYVCMTAHKLHWLVIPFYIQSLYIVLLKWYFVFSKSVVVSSPEIVCNFLSYSDKYPSHVSTLRWQVTMKNMCINLTLIPPLFSTKKKNLYIDVISKIICRHH